jgi:hypothetical protein
MNCIALFAMRHRKQHSIITRLPFNWRRHLPGEPRLNCHIMLPRDKGIPINALALGSTFVTGAVLSTLLGSLSDYLLLRLLYARTEPAALAYFHRHVRAQQRRFSHHRKSSPRQIQHTS